MSLITDLANTINPSSPDAQFSRQTTVPDFDFVLFGTAGDLATRKLLTADQVAMYDSMRGYDGSGGTTHHM